MKLISLSNLINEALSQFSVLNYKKTTIESYRKRFSSISNYIHKKYNDDYYNPARGSLFLEHMYQLSNGLKKSKKLTRQEVKISRPIRVLDELFTSNTVRTKLKKSQNYKEILPQDYLIIISKFLESLRLENHCANRTICNYEAEISKFLIHQYLIKIKSPFDINTATIKSYVNQLSIVSLNSFDSIICKLKCFLEYLSLCAPTREQANNIAITRSKLKGVKYSFTSNIKTVWTMDEIVKMVSSYPHDSPTDKRDFAIFCIIAVTGLRPCDIKTLSFDNIDFTTGDLTIIQHKTRKEVKHCLSSKVLSILVDYIEYGRPDIPTKSCDPIFIRAVAPYEAFNEHTSLDRVLLKGMKAAGLENKYRTFSGIYSLRHSFATNLALSGASIKEVAEMLGHSNLATVEKYIATMDVMQALCILNDTQKHNQAELEIVRSLAKKAGLDRELDTLITQSLKQG